MKVEILDGEFVYSKAGNGDLVYLGIFNLFRNYSDLIKLFTILHRLYILPFNKKSYLVVRYCGDDLPEMWLEGCNDKKMEGVFVEIHRIRNDIILQEQVTYFLRNFHKSGYLICEMIETTRVMRKERKVKDGIHNKTTK